MGTALIVTSDSQFGARLNLECQRQGLDVVVVPELRSDQNLLVSLKPEILILPAREFTITGWTADLPLLQSIRNAKAVPSLIVVPESEHDLEDVCFGASGYVWTTSSDTQIEKAIKDSQEDFNNRQRRDESGSGGGAIMQAGQLELWRFTQEQKDAIYEQEKRRRKQEGPFMSQRARWIVGIYVLGCILLYSGLSRALIDFLATRKWTIKPESIFFENLLDAAVFLLRPLFAVFISFWIVAVPLAIPVGLWCWGTEFLAFCRRKLERDTW